MAGIGIMVGMSIIVGIGIMADMGIMVIMDIIAAALQALKKSVSPNIYATAQRFSVAKTTLRCAIKNNRPPKCSGPPTILSEHKEVQLV
ncbi:44914_t:CDS:2, partial [Gigaspora margarita]